MSSIRFGLENKIIQLTYAVDEPCPKCGGTMRAYKNKNFDGSDKCKPFCYHKEEIDGEEVWTGCGYKEQQDNVKKLEIEASEKSLRARAMNTFKNGSYFTSDSHKEYDMDSFKLDKQNVSNEQIKAKNGMVEIVDKMLGDEIVHSFLVGPTGTGKTHLAIASAREFMERSGYTKKAMVVNWALFLKDVKKSFNDDRLRNEVENKLKDYCRCDLLVIDDLGTEIGSIESEATAKNYNLEMLYDIASKRENRNLIVTTNLTASQIKSAYDDRIYSRLMSNAKKESLFTFIETKDFRNSI